MAAQPARRKVADDAVPETVVRPPIWVEGRQRPRFDLVAFARVADEMSRRDLVPAIDDAAARLSALGQRVQRGDFRVVFPLTKRILPSHQRVGATILSLGRLFIATRALIAPPVTPETYPNLGPRPVSLSRPAKPDRLTTVVVSPEPTLHAIRSAIAATAEDMAPPNSRNFAAGHSAGLKMDPARPVPAAGGSSGPITWISSHALLVVMLPFAWPGGAVRALMYHFDGGDLRDWS